MRTVILATALLSSSAFAHQCDVNFDGQVKLDKNQLTVELTDHRKVTINGQNAWIDGKALSLNSDQQQLIQQYHSGITTLAPQVADIALEAVSMAGDGVSLAFSRLLGEDDKLVLDLTEEFSELRKEMKLQFYADDGSIRFDSSKFDNGDFGDAFEQRFEDKIESLVERSMGSLMIAVGKQMLFSGDADGFEKKMDDFGETIEHEMEFRGEKIEQKADQICYALVGINDIETKISETIPELAQLDMIDVSEYRSRHSM
ncbi:DUF2884 family protein [Neptunicella sp. SCSIO 80796]|uniref:DUF2884 family protein n=1 Tax=Neptunicella plasticusilytica TaxID=3117012 RepID=UPI003A4DCD10